MLSKMTKRFIPAILFLIFLQVGTSTTSAEVLDRIVAVMNNSSIITLSDVRKEREVQIALGSPPTNDEAVLNSLIEKHLIEEQIAQFRAIEIDSEAVEQRLMTVSNKRGLSDTELRDAIRAELRRYEFMIQRFRQFIQVTDEEVRKYYDEVLLPELQRRGQPAPPLPQVLADVRANVIAEKMNADVSEWLNDLRRRSIIEILK
jgi:hypothetical protein